MDQITNHVGIALSRAAQQLKGKPRWGGLITAIANQAQALENALWAIFATRAVATATAAQLDGLGAIVGCSRQGSIDADYRSRILAQIRLNVGSGTVEDVIAVLKLVTGAVVELKDLDRPLQLLVELHGAIPNGGTVAKLLAQARAAGVNAHLLWSTVDDSGSLVFDALPGLGDAADPTSGGELSTETQS
jgi:hypothetical protein